MTELPLLLLDVDGVLVPMGGGDSEEMVEYSDDENTVRYARALPARLAELAAAFHPVWATSWGRTANDVLCPLFGLPPLPIIELREPSFRLGETWKLAAVRCFVKDRPFAWVDDEIGPDAHVWASRRSVPALLLDVRPDHGLAQGHVDALLQFGAAIVSLA